MATITLTKITYPPGVVPTVTNQVRLRWRKSSDPDVLASYTDLPQATIDTDGTILSPTPYAFTVPSAKITVEAMLLCSGQVVTAEFPLCGPLTGVSASMAGGCAAGYTLSADGTYCFKVNTVAPIIDHSNWCYAGIGLSNYSAIGTNIYKPGFPSRMNNTNFASWIDVSMTSVPLWQSNSGSNGPMNENGVWIDSNCDGTRDTGVAGDITTIGVHIYNSGPERTVYVGLGADNWIKFVLNDVIIVDNTMETAGNCSFNFTRWNVFPVTLRNGDNYFNLQGRSDGSGDDGIAMVVYDNTKAQLQAATSYGQLNILFRSSTLKGQHIDVAHCADGYSLDTSGGQGNYVCKQTVTQSPNQTVVTFKFTPDPGYRGRVLVNLYKLSDTATVIATKTINVASDAEITDTITTNIYDDFLVQFWTLDCEIAQGAQIPVYRPVATCITPTNLRSSNIATTTAQIDWDYGAAPTNGYIVGIFKWNGVGYDQVDGFTTTNKTFNFSGLLAGTQYRAAVQADCGTSQSAPVTVDFTTAVDPVLIVRNYMTGDPASPYVGQVIINGTDYPVINIAKGASQSFPMTPGVYQVYVTLKGLTAGRTYEVRHYRAGAMISSTNSNINDLGVHQFLLTDMWQAGDEIQCVYIG